MRSGILVCWIWDCCWSWHVRECWYVGILELLCCRSSTRFCLPLGNTRISEQKQQLFLLLHFLGGNSSLSFVEIAAMNFALSEHSLHH